MNEDANEPLLNYLNRADSAFRWREVGQKRQGREGTITHLELHSQVWQGIHWKHQLLIIYPSLQAESPSAARNKAMLYVTGSYDGGITAQFLRYFAEATGATTAILYDVPNQPLFEGLMEDALIARTFANYLETGDPSWPLLFPMVKSVVAAMTALQQYEGGLAQGPPAEFIVTGASKRGWTSWLVGACDSRVCAIAPMVYNNLNLPAQAQRQLDSWGDYSDEINDYVEAGLMDHLRTAEGQRLVQMVDPYSFLDRLTLPKLLINGTNDRYWPLDAASYYYDELPGKKNLFYVPNVGHSLEDFHRVGRTMAAFYKTIAAGRSLPVLDASFSGRNWDCTMTAQSTEKPLSVTAWMAESPTSDFRSARWNERPALATGDYYSFEARLPSSGHIALFAEAEYEFGDLRYSLSTPLTIMPSIPEGKG